MGAAVCAYVGGRQVVNLWGGLASKENDTPWLADTRGMLFSATKGLSALALLMLSDRGKLDYDAPVAEYWPEFSEHGKQGITVRTLVNHRAGLCAVDVPLSLDDIKEWTPVAKALASQSPYWEPGSAQGYGAVTMGAYVAELFRRVEGRTIGAFLSEEVFQPLNAEVCLGLPPTSNLPLATIYPLNKGEILRRVVPRVLMDRTEDGRLYRAILRRNSDTRRAVSNPAELGVRHIANYNRPEVRQLELPWVNAYASAQGLARVYAALGLGGGMDGVRLCSAESLRPLQERQSWSDRDRVVLKPLGFSQGFVKDEINLFSPHIEAFGHPGAGGSVGFADPVNGVGFAYVMNKMDFRLRSPRCLRLCSAFYDGLEQASKKQ